MNPSTSLLKQRPKKHKEYDPQDRSARTESTELQSSSSSRHKRYRGSSIVSLHDAKIRPWKFKHRQIKCALPNIWWSFSQCVGLYKSTTTLGPSQILKPTGGCVKEKFKTSTLNRPRRPQPSFLIRTTLSWAPNTNRKIWNSQLYPKLPLRVSLQLILLKLRSWTLFRRLRSPFPSPQFLHQNPRCQNLPTPLILLLNLGRIRSHMIFTQQRKNPEKSFTWKSHRTSVR